MEILPRMMTILRDACSRADPTSAPEVVLYAQPSLGIPESMRRGHDDAGLARLSICRVRIAAVRSKVQQGRFREVPVLGSGCALIMNR